MKYLCYITMLLLGPALFAQERTNLRGKVVDVINGNGLASVTVHAHTNGRYTTTDKDGNFNLNNLEMPDSLSFFHLGYIEMNKVIGNDGSELYIKLHPISNEIEEIEINTGYQTIRPNEMTGSFQVIDSEVLERQTGPNILQRLNNEVVGLRFDNLPENVFGNQQLDFSVRGLSTINGPLAPLIVLDGFIYEGNISNIDPNAIESITILKDAAATSIWGARAGNGVLVLTSKGKRIGQQPTKVSVHKSNIFKQKPNFRDIYQMDAADFIDIEKFIFEKGYYDRTITRTPYIAFTPVTEILLQQRNNVINDVEAQDALDRLSTVDGVSNFSDAFLNSPFSDQYSINITGGQDKNSYGFGGGSLRDKNYDASVFEKLNLQLTNSYRPIAALNVDVLVHYTRSKLQSGKPGYNSFSFNGKRIPYLEFVDESNNPLAFNPSYRTSNLEEMYGAAYLDWNLYPLDNWRYSYSGTNVEEINSNVNIGYKLFSFLDANIGMQYQLQRTEMQSINEIESYEARLMINRFSTFDPITGLMTYNVPLGGILASNNQNGSSYTVRGQLNVRESWRRHST